MLSLRFGVRVHVLKCVRAHYAGRSRPQDDDGEPAPRPSECHDDADDDDGRRIQDHRSSGSRDAASRC